LQLRGRPQELGKRINGQSVGFKAWIVNDAQGLDTRVDLIDVSATDEPDARLFNPAAR
jgi:hypothetical protein